MVEYRTPSTLELKGNFLDQSKTYQQTRHRKNKKTWKPQAHLLQLVELNIKVTRINMLKKRLLKFLKIKNHLNEIKWKL